MNIIFDQELYNLIKQEAKTKTTHAVVLALEIRGLEITPELVEEIKHSPSYDSYCKAFITVQTA